MKSLQGLSSHKHAEQNRSSGKVLRAGTRERGWRVELKVRGEPLGTGAFPRNRFQRTGITGPRIPAERSRTPRVHSRCRGIQQMELDPTRLQTLLANPEGYRCLGRNRHNFSP
jgi:hypothetical protein